MHENLRLVARAIERGEETAIDPGDITTRTILGAFTQNRFIGVVAGALVTVLIQSSSATTVLLVSFVQAGLMSFTRTLGVILGADIGTTVTVQLIAFSLTDLGLDAPGAHTLRFYAEWTPGLPDQLTTMARFLVPPAYWDVPDELKGQPVLSIGWCWAGSDM